MGPNSSQKCARLEWPGHLLLREHFVMFYYVGHELSYQQKVEYCHSLGNRSIELTESICEFSVKLRHTPDPRIMQFLGLGKIRTK